MAVNERDLTDLLDLPYEERLRLHREAPDVSQQYRDFITSHPMWGGMPADQQAKVWKDLGFPAQPEPAPPRVGTEPPFSGSPIELVSRMLQSPPTRTDAVQAELAMRRMNAEQAGARALATAQMPGAAKPPLGASGMQAVPAQTTQMLRDALLSLFEEHIGQPVGRMFTGETPGVGERMLRGVARGHPLLAPGVPRQAGRPNFISAEHAAQMATDMFVTLPIFAGATAFTPQVTAPAALAFFTKWRGVGRLVADSAVLGGVDAGYRAMVRAFGDFVHQEGASSLREFGQDFYNSTMFMLGLGGVWHYAAKPIASGVAGLLGREAAPRTAPRVAGPSRSIFETPPRAAEPALEVPGEVVSRVPQTQSELLALAQQATTLSGPSPTSITLREGQRAVAPPPGGPGFMRSAEEVLQDRYRFRPTQPAQPNDMQAAQSVLQPSKVEVLPDGSMRASISEDALRASFIPKEHAKPGDLVYLQGGKAIAPRIVRVVSNGTDGIVVQSDSAKFFVRHDSPNARITGRANVPAGPGEVVVRPSGEEVVVTGFSKDGKTAIVRDSQGRIAYDAADALKSKASVATVAEATERVALGLKDPPPQGESVADWLVNERGSWRFKRTSDDDDIVNGRTIPISTVTSPDGKNFGAWRFFLDIGQTLGAMGRPEYDLLAKALFDGKRVETARLGEMLRMLSEMRSNVSKSEEVSGKLTRFAVGVPKPSEVLTAQERFVIDAFKEFVQANVIPAVNAKRAAFGMQPVPPTYNWALHMFPEILLSNSYAGNGMAHMFGKAIKITGVDNEIMFGSSAARLHIDSNFWELADRTIRAVAQENAWRDTITLTRQLAAVEPSVQNKKTLEWLALHLEGKKVSPDLSDVVEFSKTLDAKQIQAGFRRKGGSVEFLDPVDHTFKTRKGDVQVQKEAGEVVEFISPTLRLSGINLGDAAMTFKKLSYANTLGFNLRTGLLNVTQPLTHTLPQLPGAVAENAPGLLYGYFKSMLPLFSESARQRYRELGVLHDMEEVFSPRALTRTYGGGPTADLLYAAEYLWNNFTAATFLNMRASEIINRVTSYEATKSAYGREARKLGYEQLLKEPDWQRAMANLSEYMSNITNFLYGKGFKAPWQESLGVGATAGQRAAGLRLLAAPVGELAYQYATFATKTAGLSRLLWKEWKNEHQSFAERLAAIDAPEEFGQFLSQLPRDGRNKFLRAIAIQTVTAATVASVFGLAGISAQIYPINLYSFGISPALKAAFALTKEITSFDFVGAAGVAMKTLTPGRTAYERFQRGGTLKEKFFSTRYEMEGREPPGESSLSEQYERMMGRR